MFYKYWRSYREKSGRARRRVRKSHQTSPTVNTNAKETKLRNILYSLMEVFIVMPFWKCDPPSINDHHNVVDVVENFVSVTTECKCDQAKGNVMNLPNFYNIFELPKIVICRMVAKVHPMMILDERRFIAGDLLIMGRWD